MPRLVDYRCPDCGTTMEDMYFNKVEDITEEINCRCGGKMKRVFGAQIIIDDWSPMTNDAQRDIEHFEKKNKKRMYRLDEVHS